MTDETTLDIERKTEALLLGMILYAGRFLRTVGALLVHPGRVARSEGERTYCRPVVFYLIATILDQFALVAFFALNKELKSDEVVQGYFAYEFNVLKEQARTFEPVHFLLILAPQVILMALFAWGASSARKTVILFRDSFSSVAYAFGAQSAIQATILIVGTASQPHVQGGVAFFYGLVGTSFLTYLAVPWVLLVQARFHLDSWGKAFIAGAKGFGVCVLLLGIVSYAAAPALNALNESSVIAQIGMADFDNDALALPPLGTDDKSSDDRAIAKAKDALTAAQQSPQDPAKWGDAGKAALIVGQLDDADRYLSKSVDLYQHAAMSGSLDSRAKTILADALDGRGVIAQRLGQKSAAAMFYRNEVSLLEDVSRITPALFDNQLALFTAYWHYAGILAGFGRADEALAVLANGVALGRKLLPSHCEDNLLQDSMVDTYDTLNVFLQDKSETQRMAFYRQAIDALSLCPGAARNGTTMDALARYHNAIGDVQKADGNLLDALESYTVAVSEEDLLEDKKPYNGRWGGTAAWTRMQLGAVYLASKEDKESMSAYKLAADMASQLIAWRADESNWQLILGESESKMAVLLIKHGYPKAAILHLRASSDAWRKLSALQPNNETWKTNLVHMEVAITSLEQGDKSEN